MSCEVWIFNVGRGFSSAIKTPKGKWIVIDLGTGDNFCPVDDFLLKKLKDRHSDGRAKISQLVITHPHNDHISGVKTFDNHIFPSLLTTPNDNEGQDDDMKINWSLIENPSDDLTAYLRKNMISGRTPPLRATGEDNSDGFVFKIYFLKPRVCEEDCDLLKSNYPNNVSIVARLNYRGKTMLFCGDMMKDGMEKLLSLDRNFREDLNKYGVDFLIAPHHGLRSSFSTKLFSHIRGGKSKLNIVSEKPTKADSNQITDDRYGHRDYSAGHVVYVDGKRELRRKLRTSAVGHIKIILDDPKNSIVRTGDKVLV